ncbi:unnamed protein product [Cuscuta epithymum]|uniref:Peptidase A1 domain-containing protein n=1 Tax=Cuscuta epithymum TaxID=186058 RepID=A0AAV0CDS0_9ASTE|nr:unnamed protein product [Cuscuta epithymum]
MKSGLICAFLALFIYGCIVRGCDSKVFTAELIHPLSPSHPFQAASSAHVQTAMEYDDGSSKAAITAITNHVGSGGYAMRFSMGTPPFMAYGLIDTGSHFTWIQCKPCTDCHHSILPIFDPAESQSYESVQCGSRACSYITSHLSQGCPSNDSSSSSPCSYIMMYGDRSLSTGEVARETVTIGKSPFKNVVFGCGHKNNGGFLNKTSGIFGLGGSKASIVTQLGKQFGWEFAYCLSGDPRSKSHIRFGRGHVPAAAVTTPFIPRPQPTPFYWLTLEGITVENETMKLTPQPPNATYSEGNIIIDSGTTLTFVPTHLFEEVKEAVIREIPGVTLVEEPLGGLCYSSRIWDQKQRRLPKIVMHFAGGADVELSPKGMFSVRAERGLTCLAIMPSGEQVRMSIFGNLSQSEYLVAYDLKASKVTFTRTDCSKY